MDANALLGLAYLGGIGFAFWTWIDALSHSREEWLEVGQNKATFFLLWYAGGLLTLGLVPIAMSVWYYRSLRPMFRRKRASTHAGPSSSVRAYVRTVRTQRPMPPVDARRSEEVELADVVLALLTEDRRPLAEVESAIITATRLDTSVVNRELAFLRVMAAYEATSFAFDDEDFADTVSAHLLDAFAASLHLLSDRAIWEAALSHYLEAFAEGDLEEYTVADPHVCEYGRVFANRIGLAGTEFGAGVGAAIAHATYDEVAEELFRWSTAARSDMP
jgi:hypothetical protein